MARRARDKYVDEAQLVLNYLQRFSISPVDEREFQGSLHLLTDGKTHSDLLPKFDDWKTIHSGGEKYRVSPRLGQLIDGLVGRGLVKRVGNYEIKCTQGKNCLTLRD
jgi:hypothetical protein